MQEIGDVTGALYCSSKPTNGPLQSFAPFFLAAAATFSKEVLPVRKDTSILSGPIQTSSCLSNSAVQTGKGAIELPPDARPDVRLIPEPIKPAPDGPTARF
jgi:hypothetical protein